MIRFATKKARQIAIGVVGGVLLATGLALLVLPGPGVALIAAGVAVLAFEFEAPRRWQKRLVASFKAWRDPSAHADATSPDAPPTDSSASASHPEDAERA